MSFIPNTTPTPNWFYDEEMRKMTDTELRVVLVITRHTFGWFNSRTGGRKERDWISQKLFMQKTGKSNRALATAIQNCIQRGWIEAYAKDGNVLDTPLLRSGKKVIYKLGLMFLNNINQKSNEISSQQVVNISAETSETEDIKPVNYPHSTKEILIKENDTKKADIIEVIDAFKEVNPSAANFLTNRKEFAAMERLLETYGKEELKNGISLLSETNGMKYCPTVTTPIEFENKYPAVKSFLKKKVTSQRQVI